MNPVELRDITEKEWTTDLVELAKTLGWRRYHTYRSDRSPAGWPDEALVRERLVFIELKTETGKLSPLQAEWLSALQRAGIEVYLARPHDLDDLALVLSVRHDGTGDFPGDRRGEQARNARKRLIDALNAALGPP